RLPALARRAARGQDRRPRGRGRAPDRPPVPQSAPPRHQHEHRPAARPGRIPAADARAQRRERVSVEAGAV
ncbi:hypothetical protein LTR39_006264, partial [Cryomyces antarcticus]